MATIKAYACYTVKIYKNKPILNLKHGGRAPGAPVLDPPLVMKADSARLQGKRRNFSVLSKNSRYSD